MEIPSNVTPQKLLTFRKGMTNCRLIWQEARPDIPDAIEQFIELAFRKLVPEAAEDLEFESPDQWLAAEDAFMATAQFVSVSFRQAAGMAVDISGYGEELLDIATLILAEEDPEIFGGYFAPRRAVLAAVLTPFMAMMGTTAG